jgi:hypothetical protein
VHERVAEFKAGSHDGPVIVGLVVPPPVPAFFIIVVVIGMHPALVTDVAAHALKPTDDDDDDNGDGGGSGAHCQHTGTAYFVKCVENVLVEYVCQRVLAHFLASHNHSTQLNSACHKT